MSAQEAMGTFRRELTAWRERRGLSKKQLGTLMLFDPSYVSHIESGRHRPTEDFARRADDVLRAEGELLSLWRAYDDSRPRRSVPAPPAERLTGELMVEHEEALMRYDGERYWVTIRRQLYNGHADPVARYFVKIAVDELANSPLTWAELGLKATCRGLDMDWTANLDLAALKEIWLLFENPAGRFPLYPGERTWIEYSYTVNREKWGSWFQRAVRLPTSRLTVKMRFPADLDPKVWGMEMLMTSSRGAPVSLIDSTREGEFIDYSFDTASPPLHARYRFEWSFAVPGHASREVDSRA